MVDPIAPTITDFRSRPKSVNQPANPALGIISSQALPHYVALDGLCNSFVPCNKTFDCAMACANDGTTLKIRGGGYHEDVSMNESKTLTLEGG